MLAMLKKDLTIMLSRKIERLFLFLYIPFLLLIAESFDPKVMYFLILVSYTYLIAITPFSYDISYKTIYMLNSLPIKRKQVVLYKYLSVFIYFVLTVVYAGIYLRILNVLNLANVDYFNIEIIRDSLITILMCISIVFPAYLRFEPKVAKIVHMIVFMTFFFITTSMNTLIDLSKINLNYILGIVMIIYIISFLLSIKLYENRDL